MLVIGVLWCYLERYQVPLGLGTVCGSYPPSEHPIAQTLEKGVTLSYDHTIPTFINIP